MRTLPLLLLVACGGDPDPVDSDSDPSVDSGVVADTGDSDVPAPACAGTRTIRFDTMPDAVSEADETWEIDGVAFRSEPFNGWVTLVRDEDGCLTFIGNGGGFTADLVPTGCGGRTARFDVESTCGATGAGCTDVFVGAPKAGGPTAANQATSKDRATLTLSPVDGFSVVGMRSRGARLCSIEIDEVALTEALLPEDTGSPF